MDTKPHDPPSHKPLRHSPPLLLVDPPFPLPPFSSRSLPLALRHILGPPGVLLAPVPRYPKCEMGDLPCCFRDGFAVNCKFRGRGSSLDASGYGDLELPSSRS